MRLDARRIVAFLRDPGGCRVVLLFGDDEGLIRSHSDTLTLAVADRLDDPFRVSEVGSEAVSSLPIEAASLPLGGGRRVVRVRNVTDAALDAARTVLAQAGDGLVVLEGPGLPARSKLRTFLEGAPGGAAIGCYPARGQALEAMVRGGVEAKGVVIEAEALRWVAAQLGGDHFQTQREIEKLALYVGAGGAIDLHSAMDCVGDTMHLSLDDALFAVTAGDVAGFDRALELAVAAGQAPALALRAALSHIQRLLRARRSVDTGVSAEQAVSALQPPVFWRRQASLKQALSLWSSTDLESALEWLDDAERACRRTGAPTEVICRNALMRIAVRAISRRGRATVSP